MINRAKCRNVGGPTTSRGGRETVTVAVLDQPCRVCPGWDPFSPDAELRGPRLRSIWQWMGSY
jgi:hypothetical protein